ncbi:hypothetical protein [Geodermatophilus sp. SYSU D00815]
MTTAADDRAAEEAFEAYLAGRPVPAHGAGVAAFADAVRSSTSRPGRPNAALADLLASGLLTDQTGPSRATAPRTRRRIAMFFPALLAKIASAGAVAQAATGAGIALVAFTGAGTAGVLPDSLQHGFATVAETVGVEVADPREDEVAEESTPVAPAPTQDTGTTAGTGADTTGTTTGTTSEDDAATGEPAEGPAGEALTYDQWKLGPEGYDSFGDWVSSGARLGYANGEDVRYWAHRKGERVPDEYAAPTTPEAATVTTTETAPQPETTQSATTGTGRGNGGGNGHGNAGGNGNGGNGGGNGRGNG